MMPGQDRHSWQKAITQSRLPANARLVAHTIAVQTDPTGDQGVWLEVSDLVRQTGIPTAGTVKKHLNALVREGWLHTDPDRLYHLMFPGERGLTGRMTRSVPESACVPGSGAPHRLINPPL